MKSEYSGFQSLKINFPKMMICEDLIVLFSESGRGIALTNDVNWHVGEYSDDWDMSEFSDFTGTVTLEN